VLGGGQGGVGGPFEAVAAGLTDGRAAAGVFVLGGDVPDPGVQPAGVVLGPDHIEFGAENGGVGDRQQEGPFVLDRPVQ
jgi:hypothetical protein